MNAPREPAGIAALAVASSGGAWRVGMGGISGLDWTAARDLAGDDTPWPAVRAALRFYEAGALAGAAEEAAKRKRKEGKHG